MLCELQRTFCFVSCFYAQLAWGKKMWRTIRINKKSLQFGGSVTLQQVWFFHPKACGYFDPLSAEMKMIFFFWGGVGGGGGATAWGRIAQ